jgi:signal transduction histidine kinase
MRDIERSLRALLFLCREPAIGVKDNIIIFSNPAAVSMLGREIEGMPATSLIPEYILNDSAENFLSSAVIGGQAGTMSASRLDDFLFLSFSPHNSKAWIAPLVPTAFVNILRSRIFNIKIATDQIASRVDLDTDPKLEKYISLLYHNYYMTLRFIGNISTALALIDGSIDFSPIIADMVVICRELAGSVRHLIDDKDIELRFECSEYSLPAVVDKDKIEQLLLNLISNSIAYTEPGGRITLSLSSANNKLIISVDDTGGGISSDVLSNAFARFSSNSDLNDLAKGGSGLGLFIAKGIAELHGGAIVIESHKNKGTSVRVMLPTDTPPTTRFRDAETDYRQSGMSSILIELSGVLSHEYYNGKYFD